MLNDLKKYNLIHKKTGRYLSYSAELQMICMEEERQEEDFDLFVTDLIQIQIDWIFEEFAIDLNRFEKVEIK